MQRLFPHARKVQKISVARGSLTCPNRDGTIGRGGCIYCNNSAFTPSYCLNGASVAQQVEAGKAFFSGKYPDAKYLVYFQSFTSTHGDVESLVADMKVAAASPDVVGIILSTRPDCVPDSLLDALTQLPMRILFELGAESSSDATLRRINRGHTWQSVCSAAERISAAGLECGLHLIAGLPGETLADALSTVRHAIELPISSIKLHHLQVVRHTPLAQQAADGVAELIPFTLSEYLDFCEEVVSIVPRTIAIERFLASSPPDILISPRWGLKNYEFTNLLLGRLRANKARSASNA